MKMKSASGLAVAGLVATTQLGAAQNFGDDSIGPDFAKLTNPFAARQPEAPLAKPGFAEDNPLRFNLGESTSIQIYGFARAEAFYDFDFEQGDLSTATAVGDPANATGGEFDTSVRVSRFGIRAANNTAIGKVGAQLEFDLFGSGGSESSSPNLRLRHANVTIDDRWLFGQFWTNFMPLVHYPRTADFNGPVGISFARVPQIRYTFDAGNGLQFSGSLEEGNGGPSSDPVVTAAAFYGAERYSLRLAGLLGTFSSGNEATDDLDTYGITASGSVNPWDGATFSVTYTHGEGLGNLLIGGGARSDALGTTENESNSLTAEFIQDINDKWSVGLAYGYEDYSLVAQINGALGFDQLQSVHANVFYTPVDNLTFALEYIYIQSEGPGFSEDANRIGGSVTFAF